MFIIETATKKGHEYGQYMPFERARRIEANDTKIMFLGLKF